VQLEIKPANGYVLNKDTFAVTGASGTVYVNFKSGYSSSDGDIGYSFAMPAANVTVSATFATPITASGSLVIKSKGLNQMDYRSISLRLFSNNTYSNSAYITTIYVSNFAQGSIETDANGVTTYPAVTWEVKLAPSTTAKSYYVDIGYQANNSGTQYKELGLLFSAGNENVTVPEKTVEIGVVTMHGTLSVTINEEEFVFSANAGGGYDFQLGAYANAAYTDQIGSAKPSGDDGAWTMLIPDKYTTVYFAFETYGDAYASYQLGGKPVTTEATALTGTFTTKTITGTVTDGDEPIMAQLMLLDGTETTIGALFAKVDAGQIASLAQAYTMDGTWTATVLSDVNSAYILVASFVNESIDCYITKTKVTLTAETAIALDIGDMTYLGVYTGD
jgi:hypothetical protein